MDLYEDGGGFILCVSSCGTSGNWQRPLGEKLGVNVLSPSFKVSSPASSWLHYLPSNEFKMLFMQNVFCLTTLVSADWIVHCSGSTLTFCLCCFFAHLSHFTWISLPQTACAFVRNVVLNNFYWWQNIIWYWRKSVKFQTIYNLT